MRASTRSSIGIEVFGMTASLHPGECAFDLGTRTIQIHLPGGRRRSQWLKSPWLYQVLVRLALARADGEEWVELSDLVELDGQRLATLEQAGKKMHTLRTMTVAGVGVDCLIVPKNGIERRGPYRLGLAPSVDIQPGGDVLRRYISEHRQRVRPVAGASWLGSLVKLPPGSAVVALRWVDAIVGDRIARGVTVESLTTDLLDEPQNELRALVRLLHDPDADVDRATGVLARAARQDFSILRGVAHAVLIVRGALPPHDGLGVLATLGRDDDDLARMLAHAVLLRVVTHHRATGVRDLIFEIADFERTQHRSAFLGRDLGIQQGTFHPLAPAGVASVLVDRTDDLGYVASLLRSALANEDNPVAVRCIRDMIWLGLHYPKETFETIGALPRRLPAEVADALSTTLAIVRPRHERLVDAFLRRRPGLTGAVRSRTNPEWTSRYGAERGMGERLATTLLNSPTSRTTLAATMTLVLDGVDLAAVVEKTLLGGEA